MFIISIILTLSLHARLSHAADFQNTMFNICDKNADNKLTAFELKGCLGTSNKADSIGTRVNPGQIMSLMDLNKDGEISLPEYMHVVSNAQAGKKDPIEVIDRDGNKKTYTSEELFQKMNDSPKDLKMDGDNLVKESEGKTSMEALAKDHPMVSNVVTLSQWSLAQLVSQGIVKNGTSILNVRTLAVEEVGVGTGSGLLIPQQIYRANLELTLGDISSRSSSKTNKKKTKSKRVYQTKRYFEVQVVRDRETFLRPHLNIENVWRLDTDKEREELLPAFATG